MYADVTTTEQPWSGRSLLRREYLVAFVVFTVIHLVLAWLVVDRWNVHLGDALARTAEANFAIWARDSRLTAIGLTWGPLPTLLQLPLVLWRPWAISGLAGALVSALAAGLSAPLALATFRRMRVGGAAAWVFLIAYFAHPLVAYYHVNGMSEALFSLCLWAISATLVHIVDSRRETGLAILGIVCAVAFLIRFDAVMTFLVVLVYLAYLSVRESMRVGSQHRLPSRITSLALIYCVVPAVVIILWCLVNWRISGDPFGFLRGDYSYAVQSAAASARAELLARMIGKPVAAIDYVRTWIVGIAPLFVLLAPIVAVWASRHRRWLALALIGIWASGAVFHTLFLIAGGSAGWSRNFIDVIPGGIVVAAIGYGFATGWLSKQIRAGLLMLGLLSPFAWIYLPPPVDAFSAPVSELLRRPGPGAWPTEFSDLDPQIAADLNRREGIVLMDTFSSFGVALRLREPARAIITTDTDFTRALARPDQFNVQYILVPEPVGVGQLDAANRAYPTLYADGAGAFDFEAEWSWYGKRTPEEHRTYRLYRVRPPPG